MNIKECDRCGLQAKSRSMLEPFETIELFNEKYDLCSSCAKRYYETIRIAMSKFLEMNNME